MTLSVAVLVSEGAHPLSGRARRADADARALELALRMPGTELCAVHAGEEASPALRDYLGMGLGGVHVLSLPAGADPTEALIAWLVRRRPHLVLAGRRAEKGEGSGFLPYRIAHALSAPLLPEVCAVKANGGRLEVVQALVRGRRRRLAANLPVVVTVGPAAPAPRQSAFAKARRGRIIVEPGAAGACVPPPWTAAPAKRRPVRLKAVDPAMSAEDRLKAITEMSGGAGEALAGLSAEAAAERLLAYFAEQGLINRAADGVGRSAS